MENRIMFANLVRMVWPYANADANSNSRNPIILKRRKGVLLGCIGLTFVPNFLFFFHGILTQSISHPFNILTVLCSCVPAVYYYYYTDRLDYAQFFAYFPPTLTMAALSVFDLWRGARYGNLEFSLVLYATGSIIFFNYKTAFGFLLLNMSMFFGIKMYRYSLYPIGTYKPYELAEDLAISLICYYIVTSLAYYYKYDFINIDKKNEALLKQNDTIEKQSVQLKKTNADKDRLFSIIAHDLRSPILSLKTSIEMLNAKQINIEEFSVLLTRLESSVNGIYGMLDNLLLWSLSQMNGINPKPTVFLLYHLIMENISLFADTIKEKNINIENNFPIDLEVFGDEYQIKTVLRNLLNNALKFTPNNGSIIIDAIEDKKYITISIIDTGIGIQAKDLQNIFSGLHSKPGLEEQKGTGVGLSLCKELIEKNHGHISILSEETIGTSIKIKLPKNTKNLAKGYAI